MNPKNEHPYKGWMGKTTLLTVLALAAAPLFGALHDVPIARKTETSLPSVSKRNVTLDDIMAFRNVEDIRISPCGKLVAYVISEADLKSNSYKSHIRIVNSGGGDFVRWTRGSGSDDMPRWSPDGKILAFLSDREGSSQVWLIPMNGGEAEKLTASATPVGAFFWSPDGGSVAFLASQRESEEDRRFRDESGDVWVSTRSPKMTQLYVISLAAREEKCLTGTEYSVTDLSWSPDGKKIVFSAQPTPGAEDLFKNDVYVVDVADGKIRTLVARTGADTNPRWSPNGKSVAYLSTDGRMDWVVNWSICLVPAEGGTPRNITPGFDEFVTAPQWSADGRRIFFQANQSVSTHLFAVVPEDGKIMQLTKGLGTHSGFSFSADSRRMAYMGSDAEIPPDVFTSDVDVFVPVRVTRTNPEFEGLNLGRMEVLRWKSRDGLEIEGLLIKPVGFESGKRYPLMTYVHGGPSGKFGYSVCPQIGPPSPYQAECYPLHIWAGLGYAVFLPNPRGSYGYGEKFRTANIKDWGYGDYRDIMTGIDDLIKKGIADPDRLGIMGRSYGGYMTGWIITQTNRFRAASLGAGMFNLTSFYGQTDIPGFMDYFFGGPPWEAGKYFRKSSPHEFGANIKTPTLILHGEKDFRVPVPQAQELYKVLTKRGVPVEFAIYPRQGHLAAEPKFHLDELKRNLNWFERWMGGRAAGEIK